MAQLPSIEAEIEVPSFVELPQGAESVAFDARVTLRNTGDEDVVVSAPSREHRHFWHVFDGNHREILRQRRSAPGRARVTVEDGVHSYASGTIAAGRERHASRQLELNAKKLKEGDLYTVRAEIYGHVAEASFSVVVVPAAPARKSEKKATKKKRAKKEPAKKKARRKKAGK